MEAAAGGSNLGTFALHASCFVSRMDACDGLCVASCSIGINILEKFTTK